MYYLYQHIRLDKKQIFYIGIGTRTSRDIKYNTYTRAHTRRNRNIHWKRIVAKTEIQVQIILESEDINYIKAKEIEYIKLYGKLSNKTGILCNITDGGEGVTGYKHSDETKAKLKAKRALQGPISVEGRKRIRQANLGNKNMLGKGCTPERAAKISAANKGRECSDELREKYSAARLGIKLSEETKNKIREFNYKTVGRFDTEMILVKTYKSVNHVKEDGFGPSAVRNRCAGRREDLHKGFYWKYVNKEDNE